jgi:putative transposase
VERIWRREGLKVPQRQRPRGRLWFNDGSCVRLIDEHTRECLMIRSERRRRSSAKVIESLADVMVTKGVPEHLRSDNSPEFVARGLRKWLAGTGA